MTSVTQKSLERFLLYALVRVGRRPRRFSLRLLDHESRSNRWWLRAHYEESPDFRHLVHFIANQMASQLCLLSMHRRRVRRWHLSRSMVHDWHRMAAAERLAWNQRLHRHEWKLRLRTPQEICDFWVARASEYYGYKPPPSSKELLTWGRGQLRLVKHVDKLRKKGVA